MQRSLQLLAISVCVTTLLAQNENAVLTGRVVDPAGLGVANADLTLTEHATGSVRAAKASTEGLYRFDLLAPGDYSIRVSAPGFKTFEDSRLHLEVAKTGSLDIPLTIGACCGVCASGRRDFAADRKLGG